MPHLQSQEIFRNIWQFKRYFAIEKRDKSLTPKLKHFNVSKLEKSDFYCVNAYIRPLYPILISLSIFKVLAGLKINLFTEVTLVTLKNEAWSH